MNRTEEISRLVHLKCHEISTECFSGFREEKSLNGGSREGFLQKAVLREGGGESTVAMLARLGKHSGL